MVSQLWPPVVKVAVTLISYRLILIEAKNLNVDFEVLDNFMVSSHSVARLNYHR